jgi:Trypsin-co-occurring domain 1
MTKLQAIQIDENTVIYVEATDDIESPPLTPPVPEESGRVAKGAFSKPVGQATQNFQAIESTIRAYTTYTLKAFRELAIAEVKKVNLEFGVNVSGIGGIPYIATGTAGCNIKITVECAFPEPKEAEEEVGG